MIHQLRIYRIHPDLKTVFDDRFRDHASRIMKSYDFNIVAMWYSECEGNTEFVYILKWPDEDTMRKQWVAFMADTEWEAIKKQSRETYGEMVLAKVRDQVLTDTDWFGRAVNISELPAPLNTIVIENKRGTYKDFQAASNYPLKGVTYPVDYGFLPGYLGEDKADLDFFVGEENPGLCGYIRVSRPDTENGETKFFTNVTAENINAICEAFKPVLLESYEYSSADELLDSLKSFRKEADV